MTAQDVSKYIPLVIGSLIPLHVVLAGLTWLLHDYFVTLEDEIRHIWSQRRSFSKFMFFWIRYYSLTLLLFDVVQIHVFARPGITSNTLCLDMDPITRSAGAVLLWSVEIVMQLRVYALYGCSKRIAALNLILFGGSIAGFIWIMLFNYAKRAAEIASVIHLPLPGCPSVHQGIEWALWVPATIYEGILFGFALFKTSQSTIRSLRMDSQLSVYSLLLRDNIAYFFGIAALLIFNNLMVVVGLPHLTAYQALNVMALENLTHIPWFSYGPFHAAVGIMTTRMLINLRKATAQDFIHDRGSSDAQFSAAISTQQPSGSGVSMRFLLAQDSTVSEA